jgi:hypothetical protein
MIRLNIKVIGTAVDQCTQKSVEIKLHECELERYEPECIDDLILDALTQAKTASGGTNLAQLKPLAPEIVISLFVDEESCRPAFHLSATTIQRMGEAGASFDFDPYIYQ